MAMFLKKTAAFEKQNTLSKLLLHCRQLKRFIFSVLTLLLLAACEPAHYVPDTPNVPLLSNEGEIQTSLSTSHAGTQIKLAAAIDDHNAVMLNSNFATYMGYARQPHAFIEGAYGYYMPLSDIFRFETFGGLGYGMLDFYSFYEFESQYGGPYWDWRQTIQQFRLFGQTAIGFTTRFIDMGLATRVSILNFYQPDLNIASVFVTPVLICRQGYKWIKLSFELGSSQQLNTISGPRHIYDRSPAFSFGIYINLNHIFHSNHL